jgi:hypothetical protein
MMKRLLPFLAFLLFASVAHAQTQVDRIAATSIANRSLPSLSGTTPSVAFGNVFATANNGTITNFTNGTLTQQIWIICADTNTAIAASGSIATSGGTLNCSANTVYSFIMYIGNVWVQSNVGTGGGGGGGSTSPGLPNHSVQSDQSGTFTGDSHFLWTPSSGLGITGGNGYTHSLATGTGNLNVFSLGPSAVSLSAGQGSSTLSLLSAGNTSFTVGSANPFNLPTASGTAGTVLMSNGANPQVTSWSNAFTNGLSVPFGTITTDQNPFNLTMTMNNAAQVFGGIKWTVTTTNTASGTLVFQFCTGAGGNICFTIDPFGNVQAGNQIGSGNGSAAGNIEMLQGPLPAALANNSGWYAATSVPTAFLIQMPTAPCAGVFDIYATSTNFGTSGCSGGANNSSAASSQTASISAFTLCSAANCPSGEYRIDIHANSTQACVTPGSASLAFAITYTDNAGTKTSQSIPLIVNGGTSLSATEALGDTTHTAYGHAIIGSTGVNPIQLATTLVACSSGTAQYSYSAEVTRLR